MAEDLQPAADGVGPLLQRDYWAVFDGCAKRPSEVMAYVKAHFCDLPPPSLVKFALNGLPELASELDIEIMPAQQCKVRVVHADAQSLTLGTLEGHPEAGRITFGAYRHDTGDVVFHIRSRARSSDRVSLFGFKAMGEAMQTNTWTDFINNTADALGVAIRGAIQAETVEVDERPDDREPLDRPTYTATGD